MRFTVGISWYLQRDIHIIFNENFIGLTSHYYSIYCWIFKIYTAKFSCYLQLDIWCYLKLILQGIYSRNFMDCIQQSHCIYCGNFIGFTAVLSWIYCSNLTAFNAIILLDLLREFHRIYSENFILFTVEIPTILSVNFIGFTVGMSLNIL